ncbi:MAG TPA: hypothetical protein VJK29_17580, partial [Terriglobales bacterium]|nr:hypothetical protein [Terriglobales bacterium]
MIDVTKFYRKLLSQLSTVWLVLLLAASLGAQQPSAPPQSSPPAAPQEPKTAGEGDARITQEQKISPQDAEELFRSVDEILQFASKDTTLPIKHEVKRKLVSRDEVVAYVEKHMSEGEDAKRLR